MIVLLTFLALLATSLLVRVAGQQQDSVLYSYGADAGDTVLQANAAGISEALTITNGFPYFGATRTALKVSNNGAIYFGTDSSASSPQPFPISGVSLVATYWANLDAASSGKVYYRQLNDGETRTRIERDIRAAFTSADFQTFQARWIFLVTWHSVTLRDGNNRVSVSTFQAVLATDGRYSFATFNYEHRAETAGDSTVGLVGFNAGEGGKYYSVDIGNGRQSNSNTAGRWIFRVDASDVVEPESRIVPPPPADDLTACLVDAELDLTFIIDSSASIEDSDWAAVLASINSLINSPYFTLGPRHTQVSLVLFSSASDTRVQFYLNQYYDKSRLTDVISSTPHLKGFTDLNTALWLTCSDVFTVGRGARPGVQKVAVIITDGVDNVPEYKTPLTLSNATECKNRGVRISAIAISDLVDMQRLELIVSPPSAENLFNVSHFSDLGTALYQVTRAISCQYTTTTTTTTTTATTLPQITCPEAEVDLVFAVADIGSIGNDNFVRVKNFLISFVQTLNVGNVSVGAITLDGSRELNFHLNQYPSKSAITQSIDAAAHTGGGADIGGIIQFAREYMFQVNSGDRPNAPNYLIVMMNGKSVDQRQTLLEAASARQRGINIIAVGIGSSVDLQELSAIASPPASSNVVLADDFTRLDVELQRRLTNIMCRQSPSTATTTTTTPSTTKKKKVPTATLR